MPADRRTRSSSTFRPAIERPASDPYAPQTPRLPRGARQSAVAPSPTLDTPIVLDVTADTAPAAPPGAAPTLAAVTPPYPSRASGSSGQVTRAKAMTSISRITDLERVNMEPVRSALRAVVSCMPAPDVSLLGRVEGLETSLEDHKKATNTRFEAMEKSSMERHEEMKKGNENTLNEIAKLVASISDLKSEFKSQLKESNEKSSKELKESNEKFSKELKESNEKSSKELKESNEKLSKELKYDMKIITDSLNVLKSDVDVLKADVKAMKDHAEVGIHNARAQSINLNTIALLSDRIEPLLSLRTGVAIPNFPATAGELLSLDDAAENYFCGELNHSDRYIPLADLVGIPTEVVSNM